MQIAVYNDSVTFGGHEMMSLHGIRGLLHAGHRLTLMFSPRNIGYAEAIHKLALELPEQISLRPLSVHVRAGQVARTWLGWPVIARLAYILRDSGCERLLVLQGDIEQSSYALVAAAMIRMPCVSYIPMIMPGAKRGIRLAALRDVLSAPLYRLPDRFIVISAHFATAAKRQGARDAVVVFNAVGDDFFEPIPERSLRERRTLGVFGRISYSQKGIDTALKALAVDETLRHTLRLLIVGDGPDVERLTQDCDRLGLQGCIERRPWNSNMSRLYDEIDGLLLPSNFEGVPLVVLEALAKGLPVIASDLPGFAELLPPVSLFPRGNVAALSARLHTFRTAENPSAVFGKAPAFNIDRCRIKEFSAAFVAAVCS